MKRVHILASSETIIQYAVAPIRHNRRDLRARGYDTRLFHGIGDRLFDCDILILLSKAVFTTIGETQAICGDDSATRALIARGRKGGAKIVWVDTSDSTTVTHFELLPHVDLYLKKQILRDRNDYRRDLHGGRVFSDFYHRAFGITDSRPMQPFAPLDPAWDDKLHLAWNIAHGDMYRAFTVWGRLRERFPRLVPQSYDIPFTDPHQDRPVDLFLRTSANLGRETISFQRQQTLARLGRMLEDSDSLSGMVGDTVACRSAAARPYLPETGRRLNTREYRALVRHTKVMPSPFGWGELGARDFEAFQNGAVLLKPDMSHMDTWPNIFIPDETYVAVAWDFSDMEEKIAALVADPDRALAIAAAGQEAYKNLISADGMRDFCDVFIRQIELTPQLALDTAT